MQIANAILPLAAALVLSDGAHGFISAYIEKNSPPPIEGTAIAPEFVQAGETVLIDWEIIKRTDCPGVNTRVWQGSNGFYLSEPRGATTLPVTSAPKLYSIQTAIPVLAPPGPLSLSIEGTYRCRHDGEHTFTLGPVVMEVTE